MVKTGAILLNQFPSAVFPSEWNSSDWSDLVRAGKSYKVISSFEQYWTEAVVEQFTFVGTPEEFAEWVASDEFKIKSEDIEFGNNLLLEFLAGQKDVQLDNATYRAVSDTFKYAEAALRRGDIPQAKTELLNIELMPPVWTQESKDFFIDKINTYIGQ